MKQHKEESKMKMQNETLLSVENLSVSFDGFKAVDNLSFQLAKGEIRVIIGPNGAGKTTVLDIICGRTKATSGSIEFGGREGRQRRGCGDVRVGVARKLQAPSGDEDLEVFEK